MSDPRKYKIFIIDDDTFLLDMYSVKFKEKGLDVEISENSEEALQKLREGFEPDIILLDIVMPGIDGFEFLEIVQKEQLKGDSIIIVLSNQGQDSDIDRAKKLGAAGYIVKASTVPSEMLDQVMTVVDEQLAKRN